MKKNFVDNIAIDTSEFVQEVGGVSYLPWARASRLAGRPKLLPVLFDGRPYLAFFGGAAVAVDAAVASSESCERLQRTWLPVLDEQNRPVPLEKLTSRAVGDALARCKAKAIAMIHGVGLSVYARYGGNAKAFVEALALPQPRPDLEAVPPIVEANAFGVGYVPWWASIAAARSVDPAFRWEVMPTNVDDWADDSQESRNLPVLRAGSDYMVGVTVTTGNGETYQELLPIMGTRTLRSTGEMLAHQPKTRPSVMDWNTAVMRCLAKCVAQAYGYGMSVYADEIGLEQAPAQDAQQEPSSGEAAKSAGDEAGADAGDILAALQEVLPQDPARRERIFATCVRRGWLQQQPQSAEELAQHPEVAQRVIDAMRKAMAA